ncbi:M23 family metallopeptidase, partial [Bacteroides timonensis]|uniref:M23 family metallopeptidase n=1 Tax=Bacteroides timonensis TaxID=1470345 RepID=UPI0005C69EB6
YAMMEGEVIKVGYDRRSGNYVTIRHGHYTVSYCHLSKALVKKGAAVRPGEVVAVTGNTGRSTGEHLHLSVKYKGECINPDVLLNFVKEKQNLQISRKCSTLIN